MKQILLALLAATALGNSPATAQTFVTQFSGSGDTAVGNTTTSFNLHNDLRAMSGTVVVRWNVVGYSSNVTAAGTEWGADGLCDNITCYAGGTSLLSGTPRTTDAYTTTFGTFYVIMNGTNAPNGSMAWVRVQVKDTAIGGTNRTLTFMATKGTTGIVQTSVSEDALLLFPNPARNILNVAVTDASPVHSVTVCGLDGKQLLSQTLDKGAGTIPLEGLAAGMYFADFRDANGHRVATRRFQRY